MKKKEKKKKKKEEEEEEESLEISTTWPKIAQKVTKIH